VDVYPGKYIPVTVEVPYRKVTNPMAAA